MHGYWRLNPSDHCALNLYQTVKIKKQKKNRLIELEILRTTEPAKIFPDVFVGLYVTNL